MLHVVTYLTLGAHPTGVWPSLISGGENSAAPASVLCFCLLLRSLALAVSFLQTYEAFVDFRASVGVSGEGGLAKE